MKTYGHSFIRGVAGAYDLRPEHLAGLAPILEQHFDEARARWPDVHLSGEDFAEHLARCAPEATDPLCALEGMHTEDVYLALACARGDRAAIAALESNVMIHAPKAVARIDASEPFVAEAIEEVRVRLLVGDERPPRIFGYVGRGPLTSWVMVTAVRVAYDLKRRRNQEIPCEQPGLDLIFEEEPELHVLQDQIRVPFAEAFREALADLTARDRTVLRLYLLEDVSAEAIGKMYQVHRATVARWISTARSAVQKGTRARLRSRLQIGDTTFDSLMRHLATGLDISIASNLDDVL